MNVIDRFGLLSPAGKARLISGVVFSMLYLGLGIMFLFVKELPFVMQPTLKTMFGAVLLIYSIFRMTRVAGDLRSAGRETPRAGEKSSKDE